MLRFVLSFGVSLLAQTVSGQHIAIPKNLRYAVASVMDHHKHNFVKPISGHDYWLVNRHELVVRLHPNKESQEYHFYNPCDDSPLQGWGIYDKQGALIRGRWYRDHGTYDIIERLADGTYQTTRHNMTLMYASVDPEVPDLTPLDTHRAPHP